MTRLDLRSPGCVWLMVLAGCGSLAGPEGDWHEGVAHDLSTPEGAVLSLADAYQAGDIEAAVDCKDFTIEATLMLESLETDFSDDADLVAETAEVLELAFRAEIEQEGFPVYPDAMRTTRTRYPVEGRDDQYRVTERFVLRDGSMAVNRLLVVKTADGWKVVVPVAE